MNSLTTTDDLKSMVYRALYLWQLPQSVRVVLVRDPPTSITDLAKAADDILAVQFPASGIAAVSTGKWEDKHILRQVRQAHAVFTMPCLGRKHANVVTPLLQQLVTWPTSSGARQMSPLAASRQSGRQASSRRKNHDVCLGL